MEAAQKRIATLEAHNKLLREVAVAAEWGAYYEGDAECPICRAVYDSRKKVQEHLPDCKYRDAIDGGAMGEEPMM